MSGICDSPRIDMPAASRSELLLAYAAALASAHRRQEANEALELASATALADTERSREALGRLRRFRVLLGPLWSGEWAIAVPALGPMLNEQPQTYMVRQTLRGNLSLALVETGRLARAESLLRLVCGQGNVLLDAAYGPTLALIAAGRGDYGALALSSHPRAPLPQSVETTLTSK